LLVPKSETNQLQKLQPIELRFLTEAFDGLYLYLCVVTWFDQHVNTRKQLN